MTEEIASAIEEIEMKIAFLERAVGELSDVVFRQQGEMRGLKTQIDQLRDRLEAAQTPEAPSDPLLERPPHY